ncbi:glutathione S-transferase family protein [Erythrobacter mangrovi]|uniref:Glutathione S-transferase C-terminal domain-containing protein n=1 Tax=Erythrobacter mangrovi TaxID=2739433 RepID=A0A7D4BEP3_9SPHN|nr:glutathione S-transferase family protein [Erythrobacter mangrovi]QKG70042.1 glutathione S-transferase C-terminal domain-containing protein [Erythrobacter mangrovi]
MTAVLMHAPKACSLAARFAAAEGDVALDTAWLNLRTKELERGGSLYDFNPLGQVSTLKLDDGTILTETSVALLWIQTQSENADFRIDPSDPRYFQLVRWLGFCATELHKQIFRVVFYGEATDEVKDRIRELAPQRFGLLNRHLASTPYLLGDRFSAADAYLAWFFVLSDKAGLTHGSYPALTFYRDRVLSRPKIRELIAIDEKRYAELS